MNLGDGANDLFGNGIPDGSTAIALNGGPVDFDTQGPPIVVVHPALDRRLAAVGAAVDPRPAVQPVQPRFRHPFRLQEHIGVPPEYAAGEEFLVDLDRRAVREFANLVFVFPTAAFHPAAQVSAASRDRVI